MTEKNDTKQLIDRLEATRNLSRDEWIRLIQNRTADDADYLFERAQAVRTRHDDHTAAQLRGQKDGQDRQRRRLARPEQDQPL